MVKEAKYALNIKTGIIHRNDGSCYMLKRAKAANCKFFSNYEDALNYYEGGKERGKPCGICNPV